MIELEKNGNNNNNNKNLILKPWLMTQQKVQNTKREFAQTNDSRSKIRTKEKKKRRRNKH